MTKDEIKHINWMYNRLTSVHKENPNTDYMIRFKEIIDKQLTLCGVSQRSEQCEGKCGMSYCDDNGCIDRKRVLVEPKDKPEHCG